MHEVIVTLTQTGEVLQERARQIPKSLACMVHLAPKETRGAERSVAHKMLEGFDTQC